ncbi:flagellar assembly protein FliW [Cohnella caldifontis]|uniref:flagellar assembly protein FliW n=1 Tax=Cohnella caldifontis TaxID=3027471 RepID=UPI0023ECB384|nr:flagellar assembly protein FliW [Cohnella sp. YIM B05605]
MTEQETVIRSDRYGELHVAENQIIHFEKGIVGWQEISNYALIEMEDTPFYILHALREQLSFILIPAEKTVRDYGFEIDDDTIELLGISKAEDVVAFLIVNIVENQFYVNLRAPILIAPEQCKGCQFVIHQSDFPIRFPLAGKEEGS